MSLATFAAASLAVLLTPGPTNTLLAASGAAMGMRNALLLPVAEALGYVAAIGAFLAAASLLAGMPMALPVAKGVAACWLLYSAARLWSQPVVPELPARGDAFRRVFLTTLLNPKAMLVGTILIPGMMAGTAAAGVASFALLSIVAGAGWTLLGALLPERLRRHSYKGAAMILAGFSIAAAASALQG